MGSLLFWRFSLEVFTERVAAIGEGYGLYRSPPPASGDNGFGVYFPVTNMSGRLPLVRASAFTDRILLHQVNCFGCTSTLLLFSSLGVHRRTLAGSRQLYSFASCCFFCLGLSLWREIFCSRKNFSRGNDTRISFATTRLEPDVLRG